MKIIHLYVREQKLCVHKNGKNTKKENSYIYIFKKRLKSEFKKTKFKGKTNLNRKLNGENNEIKNKKEEKLDEGNEMMRWGS